MDLTDPSLVVVYSSNSSSIGSSFYVRFNEKNLLKAVKVVDVVPNALKVNKELNAKVCTHISRDFLVT